MHNRTRNALANLAKRFIFPGLDLHGRSRRLVLAQFLRQGEGRTLDAGCGNGTLSVLAARRGQLVTGLSNDEAALERARSYVRSAQIEGVSFRFGNLYDLDAWRAESFDQIICSEVIEHLTRDSEVVESFFRLLTPGGQLILCVPNRLHPEHNLGRTNLPETGDHVRDGYTSDELQNLVLRCGFDVRHAGGIGGRAVTRADRILRRIRHRVGEGLSIPAFLFFQVALALDDPLPAIPYSVYLVAFKPPHD